MTPAACISALRAPSAALITLAIAVAVSGCKRHGAGGDHGGTGSASARGSAAGNRSTARSGSGKAVGTGGGKAAGTGSGSALPALVLDRLGGEVMARGINVLASTLYRGAGAEVTKNSVRSPLGEAVLLALLDLGPHTALTRTSRLALDLRRGQGQRVLGALIKRITARGGHGHGALSVRSALWIGAKGRLRAGYARQARHFYGAEVHRDAPDDDDKARARVNSWLARHSRKRLGKVLARGSKRETQLLLASLVDLVAGWPVPLSRTSAPFTLGSGKRARVPMLTRRCDGALHYARYDGLDVVALPFARVGSARVALELVLLVPDLDAKKRARPSATLAVLRQRLDPRTLRRITAMVGARSVPKARLQKTRRRVGKRLGAFLRRQSAAGRARPLCVDVSWPRFFVAGAQPRALSTRNGSVVSAALLGSSVIGTRAAPAGSGAKIAAAVAADTKTRAKRAKQPGALEADVLDLRVDRPFIFVVRERQSGLIVMIGHVVDPRQAPRR